MSAICAWNALESDGGLGSSGVGAFVAGSGACALGGSSGSSPEGTGGSSTPKQLGIRYFTQSSSYLGSLRARGSPAFHSFRKAEPRGAKADVPLRACPSNPFAT